MALAILVAVEADAANSLPNALEEVVSDQCLLQDAKT